MSTSRIAAGLIALIALVGLVIRVHLVQVTGKTTLESFSFLYQFFTIWTNTLVMLIMTGIAINQFNNKLATLMATVAIIGVGIIFHSLLGSPPGQQGLDLLANLITHTFVPILCPLWWLVFQSNLRFHWKNSFVGMIFPIIYCVYALLRAEVTGFYPYPFIDLETLGVAGLIKSIAFISFAFFSIGVALVAINKLAAGLPRPSAPNT